jgi:hypothetical protein
MCLSQDPGTTRRDLLHALSDAGERLNARPLALPSAFLLGLGTGFLAGVWVVTTA